MIIPVRCFTCSNVLADKYRYYLDQVRSKKIARGQNIKNVVYLTEKHIEKTPEGEVLDELELHKYCCRSKMLTHVDIE